MGCFQSKQIEDARASSNIVGGSLTGNNTETAAPIINEPPPLPEINLAGLDPISRFEFSLPFYRIKIETLEKRLKRATGDDKKTLTLEEFQAAFAKDSSWDALNDSESLLRKVLNSEYFKTESNVFELNRDALILMGVLHSKGDLKTKTRVFYDVLQDNNQSFIAASDKDFGESYGLLLNLATKLVYSHLHLVAPEEQPKIKVEDFGKIDDNLEEMQDWFLDEVFGPNSKLQRAEWEKNVSNSPAKWLFDPKKLRAKVEQHVNSN